MLIPVLVFLSALVYYPTISDAFTLPKTIYLSLVGLIAGLLLLNQKEKVIFPIAFPLSFYLFISGLSGFWAVNPYAFFNRFAQDVLGCFLFWATVNLINRNQIERLVNIFVRIVVSVLIIGTLSILFPFFSSVSWSSTMGNHGYLVMLIVVMLPLLCGSKRFPDSKIIWGLIWIFMAYLFLLGSSMGLLLFIGILFIFYFPTDKFVLPGPLIISSLVVGLLFFFTLFLTKPDIPEGSSGYKDRLHLWLNTSEMVKDNLRGVGRGNFELLYPKYIRHGDSFLETGSSYEKLVFHVHNDYLELLVEGGPMMLFAFLWFFAELLWPVKLRQDLAFSIFCYVIFMFFWFPLHHPTLAAVFWVLCGLLWVSSHEKKVNNNTLSNSSVPVFS